MPADLSVLFAQLSTRGLRVGVATMDLESGAADAAMPDALCNHLIVDISELVPCLAMHAAGVSSGGPGA